MKQTTDANTTTNAGEIIRATTILHCLVTQLDHIDDYLQAMSTKSPAASVYADMMLDAMDKIADVETILINLN